MAERCLRDTTGEPRYVVKRLLQENIKKSAKRFSWRWRVRMDAPSHLFLLLLHPQLMPTWKNSPPCVFCRQDAWEYFNGFEPLLGQENIRHIQLIFSGGNRKIKIQFDILEVSCDLQQSMVCTAFSHCALLLLRPSSYNAEAR